MARISRRLTFCLAIAIALLNFQTSIHAQQAGRSTAIVLTLDGAIGPASASYIDNGLIEARARDAELVILEMDTPGGLDTSMRDIIQAILAMPVPVVTYVHPSGARAASAGTYIAYASHVAAMTPGTNLGAATPIQLGGGQSDPDEGTDRQEPASAGERKAVNDAVAYIRSLAELRGRNADWAEDAVRGAASLSAQAALERNVIQIVADNRADLLRQLHGMTVEIAGREHRIDTKGIAVTEIAPGLADKVLATITDPNVALILMMVGIYGLIFEFMNPGAMVPGTIGAISLLIGLYALAALPLDFAGAGLIVLGLALMVAEAFAPSFGILGMGGLLSFVLGAVILIDTDVPAFQINWSVIAALGVAGTAMIVVMARLGIRSHGIQVQTGEEELLGSRGEVLDWKNGKGHVFVHSERWSAEGPQALAKGAAIVVDAVNGLRLKVTREEPPDQ
ncbi:NfeD family protein [Croceicoccus ponticola]|uniref:NfeD family protein n=1 Tax=Croceicoccus ponticola TaxID=2217664 RepID=UPI0013E3B197|nr:nodulation protein NfeD [Croceicoccus ponticola]